jgi:hypothetical protein
MGLTDTWWYHLMRLFLVWYGGCMILLHGLLIVLDLWDINHSDDLSIEGIQKNIQTRVQLQHDASSKTAYAKDEN